MKSKFCLAMDNYFTLPKVIVTLRDMGIGNVGTVRYHGSWPPKELINVSKESAKFNEFYWTIGLMDNDMVFCVSTMHNVGNRVKRMRKRPRKTVNNKNHIDKIWGEKGATDIYIPSLIDNYNYWMGGEDVADHSAVHATNLPNLFAEELGSQSSFNCSLSSETMLIWCTVQTANILSLGNSFFTI